MSGLRAGSEIAGYRLTSSIGSGGMADVWLAEAAAGGGTVVLKLLREQAARSDEVRRRFVREARYAATLEHANIVPVLGAGEEDGQHYIAMRHVPGSDLRTLLSERGALPAAEALAILAQVAEALDAAHAAGLLHRDVKPGNVLIASGEGGAPAGRAYLTDFGLGKRVSGDSRALTAAGEFAGTVLYVAPEQMLGAELDGTADVYALGCVLYEALVGEPPFTGTVAADLMQAHLESSPPRPSKVNERLPEALDGVLARALAKEPAERWASASELIDAARAALGHPASAREPGAFASAPPGRGGGTVSLRLEVTAGMARGGAVDIGGELLIGRDAQGPGTLGGDPQLSGEHARIRRTGAAYVIADLGSTHGTRVNGRLLSGEARLRSGDVIEVGTSLLTAFLVVAAPATRSLRFEVAVGAADGTLRVGDPPTSLRLVHEAGRWRLVP